MLFEVSAGKYCSDEQGNTEENCKYAALFETFDEAVSALDTVSDYPWSRITVRTTCGRTFELTEVDEVVGRQDWGSKYFALWAWLGQHAMNFNGVKSLQLMSDEDMMKYADDKLAKLKLRAAALDQMATRYEKVADHWRNKYHTLKNFIKEN